MYGTQHTLNRPFDGTGYFSVTIESYNLDGDTVREVTYGYCQPWMDEDAITNAYQQFHGTL